LDITYSKPEQYWASASNDYKDILNSKVDPSKHRFVLAVLPTDSKELYDSIKQILVLQKPVPSQCVVKKNISGTKGIHSKATKIAVQLASKLGGAP
jgi:hypothetical protein